VEVYGVVKALVDFASSKFAAAKWPPSSRLRETYRTLTDEELELARAAEALFVDIAAGGSAFAASELVNAGASEFLARRLRSLLSPEGDLLGVDGFKGEVAAEARTLARALARVLMRNGAACLAEAARRDGAVEAVVRAFLASWRGTLGRAAISPRSRRASRTFADADLRVAELEVFAEERAAERADRPERRAPLGTIRALRAGFARAPHRGAFGGSEGDGTVRGRVCFLDVPAPDPKRRETAPASLPAATRRFSREALAPPAETTPPSFGPASTSARREASSSSLSLRPGGETDADADEAALANASRADDDEDIEPWGGSDAGSDEVMWLGESELEDAVEARLTPPRGVGSARGARDGASSRGGRTSADDPPDRRETETETEDVSLVGAVAVFRGERGGWRAHEHVVRQAPRLAHLAQAAGAVAVVFLWPDRAPKYPPRAEPAAQPQLRHAAARARVLRARVGVRGDGETPTDAATGTSAPVGGARSRRAPRRRRQRGVRRAAMRRRARAGHVAAPQRTRRRGAREPARQLWCGARARPALARARARRPRAPRRQGPRACGAERVEPFSAFGEPGGARDGGTRDGDRGGF
jgi:hypothetical protein